MLLDDLAQPMNYESQSRRHVVNLLMDALRTERVDPKSSAYLLKYPPTIEKFIVLARADDYERTERDCRQIIVGFGRRASRLFVRQAGLSNQPL